MDVFCPNCGTRWYNVNDSFLDAPSGCGACAQAQVRPRELYQLRRLDEWSKSRDLDLAQPLDLCVCGHVRSAHIYHEGACRPGFKCAAECKSFTYPSARRPASFAIEGE